MVHIAGAFFGAVGVLEVEIEVPGLNLVDGDTPGAFVFDTGLEAIGLAAPPSLDGIKLLDADGFGLVVALGSGR